MFIRNIYIPSKLEIQVKKGVDFSFILVGTPSSLICPIRIRYVGDF